jgi:Lar family restriction alleviation protein
MSELKPCPFCGGENIVMRDVCGLFGKSAHTRTYRYMQCRDCMSQTGFHGTKPKTIEAWNRRVDKC